MKLEDKMKTQVTIEGKTMYTRNEVQTISRNMIRYGGGFFKLIGDALQRADEENTNKLIKAFPDECIKYLNGWK